MSQAVNQPALSRSAIALRATAIAVPLVLLLGTVIMLTYHSEARLVREAMISDEQASLRLRGETLVGHVRDILRDVRFLATGPASAMAAGDSPQDARMLARVFMSLMDAKPYDQVRYIDAEGFEAVRVDRAGGVPALVSTQALQDKSDRYYFKDAMALKRGQIYVSPLDLNEEKGRLEEPYKPVMRFATPLYRHTGEPAGVLVINALMQDVLDRIARHTGTAGAQIMLVDSVGYWLQSPYPDDEWGFQIMSRATRTFPNDHPDAWRAMRTAAETVVNTDKGLFLSHDVNMARAVGSEPAQWDMIQRAPLGEKHYYLRFISFVPREVIARRLTALRRSSLGLFGAGSLAAAVLSLLLAVAVERARTARKAATNRSRLLESTLRDLEASYDARRKAERKARDVSRRLQYVLEAASEVAVISTDTEGVITLFNSGAVKMLGYEADEVVGRLTPAVFHKEEEVLARSVELSWELDRRVEGFDVFVTLPRERGQEHRQWTYMRKDGGERLVDLVVTAVRDEDGTIVGYLGVAVDVTERRTAERQLELRNLLLSAMSEASPDGILVVGADKHSLYVNQRFLDIWGLPPEAFEGRPCTDVMATVARLLPNAEGFMERVNHLYANPNEKDHCEVALTDGRTLERHSVGLVRTDGTHMGRLWNYRDITDRKQAERAVRDSEARLNAILEGAADGIVTIGQDGVIQSVNPAAAYIFGHEPEDMIGRDVNMLQPEPVRSEHPKYLRRYLETSQARIIGKVGREVEGLRKDGSTVPLELAVSEVLLEGGPDRPGERLFTGILRDITERKEAEAAILRAKELLEDKQRRIDRDLKAAADIQRSLLPSSSPVTGSVEIDWTFRPSQHIGGDIFNLFALDEHLLGAYILDVSGHGVPSALVTVSVSQVLTPSELLTGLNWQGHRVIRAPGQVMDDLSRDFPMERFDMFFTMSYLILNTRTGELEYSNAGHPPPLLTRASGELESLAEGAQLIGLGDLAGPYPTGSARLEPGDMVLLYTDGLTEYMNPQREQYEQRRLEAVLSRMAGRHVDEVLEAIMDDVTAFGQGLEPDDDISMVCIRFTQANGDKETDQ